MNLALFDFDGTLTRKDSMMELLRFMFGFWTFWSRFLLVSPVMFLLVVGVISNHKAKEIFLSVYISGIPLREFQAFCDEFGQSVLPGIIRKEAFDRLKEHQENGDRVIVVSASAENWLAKWCTIHDIELIGTKLEVNNDRLTGKISGRNCNGPEKLNRIKGYLSLSDFHEIYAYGDSNGDTEMLSIATSPMYRRF